MPVCSPMPVLGLSAVQSRTFRILFGEYERRLVRAGYNHTVVRLHLHSIAHLGVWIECEARSLKTIDEETLEVFGRHRATCTCPGTSRNRARQVLSCVRRFVQHLRERGIVPLVEAPRQPLVEGFLQWMSVHRGVVEGTLASYGSYVGDLVRFLGDDPQMYTARGLRDFVGKRCRQYRRNSSRMVLAAVRMFLRYLAVEGRCRPGLAHALTPLANWSQHSLPRGLTPEQVRRGARHVPVDATRPSRSRGAPLTDPARATRRRRVEAALLGSVLRVRRDPGVGEGRSGSPAALTAGRWRCAPCVLERRAARGTQPVRLPPLDGALRALRHAASWPRGRAYRAGGLEASRRAPSDAWRACLAAHGCLPDAAPGRRTRRDRRGLAPSLRRDDRHLREGGPGAPGAGRSALAGGGAMLSAAVDAYLAARRAAGFQLSDHEGILRDFARFASAKGDAFVRARTVLEWVRARDGNALRRCVRLRTVVHLARFLQAEDERHEVPPQDAFGRQRPRRRPPFLFTPPRRREGRQPAHPRQLPLRLQVPVWIRQRSTGEASVGALPRGSRRADGPGLPGPSGATLREHGTDTKPPLDRDPFLHEIRPVRGPLCTRAGSQDPRDLQQADRGAPRQPPHQGGDEGHARGPGPEHSKRHSRPSQALPRLRRRAPCLGTGRSPP